MATTTEERMSLWADDTVFPDSQAMICAMREAQADLGLVREWQDHVRESYTDTNDWICYRDWLEVELEITLEQLTNVTVRETHELLSRATTITREIAKGTNESSRVLVRTSPSPSPLTPLYVNVSIPGRFTANLTVAEEKVEVLGWTFTPSASAAGYFGPSALLYTVETYDDSPVTEPEFDAMHDFLNPNASEGPFWQAVQETLGDNPTVQTQWIE